MPPNRSFSASSSVGAGVLALTAACGSTPSTPAASGDAGPSPTVIVEGDFVWRLPAGFPKPNVPKDNGMSLAKVELGRRLFYDTRLSVDGTFSCASCHDQTLAFTDGKARGVGVTGQVHPRSSMGLANVGYASSLTWANDLVGTLEKQALVPMFGESPVELGLAGKETELLDRLRSEPVYQDLFPRAFPGDDDPIRLDPIVKAIAAFQRTLISGDAPYDRFVYGKDDSALSASAKRGKDLFFSERAECFHCHGGFNFSDSVTFEGKAFLEVAFHNTGLYNVDGNGGYPTESRGLIDISGKPRDMGRFKAPSLRNVAVTAPYMHDGSIATLEEVIAHYARGGRQIASGPNAGDGSTNPLKSEFVRGFTISPDEIADLIAFLESLTDRSFLTDPRFSDPWKSP
jgi:cytochrome c peroxidase